MSTPAPSQRLGPYELIEPIGKGGMGEVWRARDSRLGRDVAVKASAQQFSDRFEREARAIAALNHPNICTLFDVGPNYLVMELVEGPTLADRIKQGPIPLEEALAIAQQIADGLEAAHERGIIHRDLKPANLKLRPDGSVKILDFGLAKAAIEEGPLTSDSPTMLSMTGMILGTAGYMAPEQAKGKTVDRRADIFAFGVVVYEMVTGQRLFPGETISDTLAAVIKDEPDWKPVPAKVQRLLARCLEKDPNRRLKSIGDWSLLVGEAVHAPTAEITRRPRKAVWVFAAAGYAAAAVLAAWIFLRPQPLPEVTRFQIFAPPGSTLPLGTPAPSPDGRSIAYTVRGPDGVVRIHVRALNSTVSRALPGTEDAVHPFWSPDGESIAFAAAAQLKRVDVAGGASRTLARVGGPWHGSWNQTGNILFSGQASILQVSANGGSASPAAKTDENKGESIVGFPTFLEDGKRFLVRVGHVDGTNSIELARLGSAERKPVLTDVLSAPILAPAPNGKTYLLYLNDSSLMAREFDERAGTVAGAPFLLLDSVGLVASPALRPSLGVSPSGVLAFQTVAVDTNPQLIWRDRAGKVLDQFPKTEGGYTPSISPDGRFLAVSRNSGIIRNIWVTDLVRGSSARFTFSKGTERYPVWSSDGKRIAYSRDGTGAFVKDVDGTAPEQPLVPGVVSPESWTPDGRQILFRDDALRLLFLWPLSGEKKRLSVASSSAGQAAASPDGKYLAFASDESGRWEVYIQAMPPASGKWQISIGGGASPRWRRDGRELFFLSLDEKMMAADIGEGQGISAGIPHALFQVNTNLRFTDRNYDVSADGQRFVISTDNSASLVDAPITVVLNWWAELKGKGK